MSSSVSSVSSVSMTVFQELRMLHPTWARLRAYLTSVEGGSLTCAYQDIHYALVHYTKGKSNLSLPHVRAFRSVVWDIEKNVPVSVTPAKSEDGESIPNRDLENGFVMPFYDGVMVGQFFCVYTGRPLLHTRTYFGGANTFYGKKSFGEMFDEAGATTLTEAGVSSTYILQHPENRIVTPVSAPRAILVHTATFLPTGIVESRIDLSRAVPYVRSYTSGEVLRRYRELLTGPLEQGLVIYDAATGRRHKIRTPEYTTIRRLRGNNASLPFLWLSLWQSEHWMAYLRAYPEERSAATALLERWKAASSEVYSFYKNIFKAHTMTMQQAPPKYKPLLHELHQIYKTTLQPHRQSVTWEDCKRFMNGRDVPQMLYILNWDLRSDRRSATAVAANPVAATAAAAAAVAAAANPVAASNVVVLATADDTDYSDMPGLISVHELLAPPPAAAVARAESGPVY